MGDLLLGIALIFVSIVIYARGGNFPQFGERILNPGSYPRLIAVIMAGLCLMLLGIKIKDIQNCKKEGRPFFTVEDLKQIFFDHKIVFGTLITFYLYTVLMRYLGFITSSLLFIVLTGLLIGPRTKKSLFLLSVVALFITFGCYYFFQNVLYVRFPRGIFF